MLKKTISVLSACIIFLTVFSPFQVKTQTQPNEAAENKATETQKNNEVSDLRKIFAKPIVNDVPVFDSKRLEKDNFYSPVRAGLNGRQRSALYIGIPAAIASAIIIGITGRNSDSNCGRVVCQGIGICPPTPPPCDQ